MTALPPVPVPFLFNAWIVEWHDGDTVLCRVDRGDRDYSMWSVRILGSAARELKAPGGVEVRDECTRRWPPGTPVVLATVKPDKWRDRKDARLFAATRHGGTEEIAAALIADHWAAPWDGRGTQPQPPWPRP